jgi:hypothetical protein
VCRAERGELQRLLWSSVVEVGMVTRERVAPGHEVHVQHQA